MPDFKFWDEAWSNRYCNAPDYREVAIAAIREMHRQVGELIINDDGVTIKGLLIRHLVMPRNIGGTEKILNFIANEISSNTYVNVMDQYRPSGEAHKDEFISRRLTAQEFKEAMDKARESGLKRLDPRDRVRFVFALR